MSEEKKMKIYIVTSGAYSDYGIDSVWSTEEKAKAYIAQVQRGNGDVNEDVEEYEVDAAPLPSIRTLVKMDREGNLVEPPSLSLKDVGFNLFMFREYRFPLTYDILWWVVDTEDATRAVKTVNERRAIILAHNLWGKNREVRELFEKRKASG